MGLTVDSVAKKRTREATEASNVQKMADYTKVSYSDYLNHCPQAMVKEKHYFLSLFTLDFL